jgi:GxxExxY protein
VGAGRLDFFVEDELVVEIKAVDRLTPLHTAQVMSYLKAVDRSLGLLLNFKVAVLKQGIQRVVLSNRQTKTLGVLGVLAVDNN